MKTTTNDGRDFEKDLARICGIYRERGVADLEKVEPPVRVLGHGPGRKVIFMENPFLDFTGALTFMGGRACHFEAKSTTDPVLPCGKDYGFTDTQRRALSRWRRSGAAAFLLWECGGRVRIFFEDMIEAGLAERKSLVWADGLDVPAGNGFIFYDFVFMLKQFESYL